MYYYKLIELTTMKKLTCQLAISLFILSMTLSAAAQQPDPQNPVPENMAVPSEWEVRLDNPDKDVTISSHPDSADIFFVNMKPGWHITTGPRAIFWHPASSAKGTYRAYTKIHLFDPKGRNEAFGLFFGGKNLKEENQTYTYFLLRNSGEYLIKKRIGDGTEMVKGWTNTNAMVQFTDATETSVANSLSVEVGDEEISFFVNGEKVETLPKNQVDIEGLMGLRVNHQLDLHIEDFGVEKLE